METWQETEIWRHLESLNRTDAIDAKRILSDQNCLPKIERVLKSGGHSITKDYTLHDNEHSFRVAELMWQIIPDKTKKLLSGYECMMLLLAAYLHDIGMSPDLGLVNGVHHVLSKNETVEISDHEINELQSWLDREGFIIDLQDDLVPTHQEISQIMISYCRHRHNDWSENWINMHLTNLPTKCYPGFLPDLVSLCKSHHSGIEGLKSDTLNPIRIHGYVIHLRYLAMVLRLADVMEIDPERAPDVLIKHRGIIPNSVSHWLKEQSISISLIDGKVIVTARPQQAFIHKAVFDVCEWIEAETKLCHQLIEDIPLSNISPSNDLKHKWNIQPGITKDIKENGNYKYIDGTFRPNSKKLIQLLAGAQLYDDPKQAIRELLQNSLDAIKVQIGHRLVQAGEVNDDLLRMFREKSKVTLRLYDQDGYQWISCLDNGVGMNESDLHKSFLVAGSKKTYEIAALERDCKKIGHDLNLTSQFGIGVLSYFMIADEITVKTSKSRESSAALQSGLEFCISSLEDFGELRIITRHQYGTEIVLRIKKDLCLNGDMLVQFLTDSLIRLECTLIFIDEGTEKLRIGPGWVRTDQSLKHLMGENLRKSILDKADHSFDNLFYDQQAIAYQERIHSQSEELIHLLHNSIDFLTTEGKLDDNLGWFRIKLAVYRYRWGTSLTLLPSNAELMLDLLRTNLDYYHSPMVEEVIGWKGIHISSKNDYSPIRLEFRNFILELDFYNSRDIEISVSRNEINLRLLDRRIRENIRRLIKELLIANFDEIYNNSFGAINNMIIKAPKSLPLRNDWTYLDDTSRPSKLATVTSPILFIERKISGKKHYTYLDQPVSTFHFPGHFDPEIIWSSEIEYDKAVMIRGTQYEIGFLKTSEISINNYSSPSIRKCLFPDEWSQLLFISYRRPMSIMLNKGHNLAKLLSDEDFEFVANVLSSTINMTELSSLGILSSAQKCLAFIISLCSIEKGYELATIEQQNEGFWTALLSTIFLVNNNEHWLFIDSTTDSNILNVISRRRSEVSNKTSWSKYLPEPRAEWVVDTIEGS